MSLESTTLITELQNWPNYFVIGSIVNKYDVPFPTKFREANQTHHDDSFIRLLFDDNWDRSSYRMTFEQIEDFRAWPTLVRERLMIYPSSKYYRLADDSTSSINIFFLDEDVDIPMLDTLLKWRNDSTSVSIIDSTANVNPELVYDVEDNLTLFCDYYSLTPLSKLIYCFLALEIYEEYDHLITPEIISTTPLEHFYELYINDKFFKLLSERGWGP